MQTKEQLEQFAAFQRFSQLYEQFKKAHPDADQSQLVEKIAMLQLEEENQKKEPLAPTKGGENEANLASKRPEKDLCKTTSQANKDDVKKKEASIAERTDQSKSKRDKENQPPNQPQPIEPKKTAFLNVPDVNPKKETLKTDAIAIGQDKQTPNKRRSTQMTENLKRAREDSDSADSESNNCQRIETGGSPMKNDLEQPQKVSLNIQEKIEKVADEKRSFRDNDFEIEDLDLGNPVHSLSSNDDMRMKKLVLKQDDVIHNDDDKHEDEDEESYRMRLSAEPFQPQKFNGKLGDFPAPLFPLSGAPAPHPTNQSAPTSVLYDIVQQQDLINSDLNQIQEPGVFMQNLKTVVDRIDDEMRVQIIDYMQQSEPKESELAGTIMKKETEIQKLQASFHAQQEEQRLAENKEEHSQFQTMLDELKQQRQSLMAENKQQLLRIRHLEEQTAKYKFQIESYQKESQVESQYNAMEKQWNSERNENTNVTQRTNNYPDRRGPDRGSRDHPGAFKDFRKEGDGFNGNHDNFNNGRQGRFNKDYSKGNKYNNQYNDFENKPKQNDNARFDGGWTEFKNSGQKQSSSSNLQKNRQHSSPLKESPKGLDCHGSKNFSSRQSKHSNQGQPINKKRVFDYYDTEKRSQASNSSASERFGKSNKSFHKSQRTKQSCSNYDSQKERSKMFREEKRVNYYQNDRQLSQDRSFERSGKKEDVSGDRGAPVKDESKRQGLYKNDFENPNNLDKFSNDRSEKDKENLRNELRQSEDKSSSKSSTKQYDEEFEEYKIIPIEADDRHANIRDKQKKRSDNFHKSKQQPQKRRCYAPDIAETMAAVDSEKVSRGLNALSQLSESSLPKEEQSYQSSKKDDAVRMFLEKSQEMSQEPNNSKLNIIEDSSRFDGPPGPIQKQMSSQKKFHLISVQMDMDKQNDILDDQFSPQHDFLRDSAKVEAEKMESGKKLQDYLDDQKFEWTDNVDFNQDNSIVDTILNQSPDPQAIEENKQKRKQALNQEKSKSTNTFKKVDDLQTEEKPTDMQQPSKSTLPRQMCKASQMDKKALDYIQQFQDLIDKKEGDLLSEKVYDAQCDDDMSNQIDLDWYDTKAQELIGAS